MSISREAKVVLYKNMGYFIQRTIRPDNHHGAIASFVMIPRSRIDDVLRAAAKHTEKTNNLRRRLLASSYKKPICLEIQ